MASRALTTYVAASPQTWELVRAAYLGGLSAPVAAARFGVSVAAIRKRAGREGWTKAAYAVAAGPYDARAAEWEAAREAAVMGQPYIDAAELARHALKLAAQHLRQGRPAEAQACAKAAETILKLDEIVPPFESCPDTDEAVHARQSILTDAIWEHAMNLAGALREGRPVPARFAEAARRWGWSLTGEGWADTLAKAAADGAAAARDAIADRRPAPRCR